MIHCCTFRYLDPRDLSVLVGFRSLPLNNALNRFPLSLLLPCANLHVGSEVEWFCHTVGNSLVVACCYFMLVLLLRFPLILLWKTESSIDGILLKKGLINLPVVLLF